MPSACMPTSIPNPKAIVQLTRNNIIYSKEDHAVLEEEYQRDPKPDKATRTSIVERVTLGEKEVQVCCSFELGKTRVLQTALNDS